MRRAIFVLWLLLGGLVCGSEYVVSTLAGNGMRGFSGDGGMAIDAQLDNPFGVVRGPDGAIWFCEYTGHKIRRINKAGILETVVGTGVRGYTGDGGPGREATFNLPHEIRFDRSGDLFVADMANHVIRKVDMKSGVISTFAGNGSAGYSGDGGPAIAAQLKQPHSIQFSPEGDLYICDTGNHVIRRVDAKTGAICTYAGTGHAGPTPDGAPIEGTALKGPRSLEFDALGNLWVVTREGNQLFRFDRAKGLIHHVAGSGRSGFTGNGGLAREATLSGPKGLALDSKGNVWLVDTESHSLRMVDAATGRLELMLGTGEKGDGPDGDPLRCMLARPHGVFVDADDSVFVGDSETHRVRVMRKR